MHTCLYRFSRQLSVLCLKCMLFKSTACLPSDKIMSVSVRFAMKIRALESVALGFPYPFAVSDAPPLTGVQIMTLNNGRS